MYHSTDIYLPLLFFLLVIKMSQEAKKVLFFPLNSPGHINSSLGIADILKQDFKCRTIFLLLGKMIGTSIQDRGHELIMLDEVAPYEDYEFDSSYSEANNDNKLKRKFEGALKWPQLIQKYSHIFQQEPVEAFVNSAEIMEKFMVTELTENHDNYAKVIEQLAPDLIVVDAYYIPPCVVNYKQGKWARLYSANPMMIVKSKLVNGLKPPPMIGFTLYDKLTRQRMQKEEPQKWNSVLQTWQNALGKIVAAMGEAGGPLNEFLAKHDVPALPPGQQAHDSPFLNIYMYPKALDYDQDDDLFEYPERWIRCDSMLRKNPDAGSTEDKELACWRDKLSEATAGKEAVVFFSLGSLASGNITLMQRYVDILRHDSKRLYVISKGVNGDKYQLDTNNMIGDNYIPQTFFLERANLALIHGGNNSVTECMYYGLPMIVLPVFADQLDNAQRVEDLGYGRRLNVDTCTQDQLLDAINSILSDKQLIERMRLIGEEMRARDDLQKISSSLFDLMK